MCDDNENVIQPVFSPFFKRKQRKTEPWAMDMALNMSALYKKVRNIPSSCWLLYFLNGAILMTFVVKNVVHITISKKKPKRLEVRDIKNLPFDQKVHTLVGTL
jgi:hypothetical protein